MKAVDLSNRSICILPNVLPTSLHVVRVSFLKMSTEFYLRFIKAEL
jgi:hypothetical protein